jgi:UDP-N-acetylmuramate--alanine ligase
VFQPHLYSRTAVHGAALGQALAAADLVVVAPIYGAREAPMPGVTADLVIDAARAAGAETVAVADRAKLTSAVAALLEPGDLLLTMGAGDVTRVGPEVLAARRGAGRERTPR